ncbi:hypothetical protein ACFX2B_027260 [Malus domestica]
MKIFSKINKKHTCLSDLGLDLNSDLASSWVTTLGTDRCCKALEILKSTEVALLRFWVEGKAGSIGFLRLGFRSRRGGWDVLGLEVREEFELGGALRLHSSWVVQRDRVVIGE